jgi:hypothetical protein
VSSSPGLGPGVEGAVAGAAVALTLYGVVVLAASSILGEELVPHSEAIVGALLVVLAVVGGVLGLGAAKRTSR